MDPGVLDAALDRAPVNEDALRLGFSSASSGWAGTRLLTWSTTRPGRARAGTRDAGVVDAPGRAGFETGLV